MKIYDDGDLVMLEKDDYKGCPEQEPESLRDLEPGDFKIPLDVFTRAHMVLYIEGSSIQVLKARFGMSDILNRFKRWETLRKEHHTFNNILRTPEVLPILMGIDPHLDESIEKTLKACSTESHTSC